MNTGIKVKTGFFPLAWFLYMCTPVIQINGEKNTRKWGDSAFELEPGDYTVKIYFPYIFMPECGANTVSFTLTKGETKNISYRMPPWMFSKGKMTLS